MSGAGFNGIEALRSRVLMDVEALSEWLRKILWLYLEQLSNRNGHQTMSGAGFNGIEALRSCVFMDVKALGQIIRKVILWLYRSHLH